jgi:hypothetical protein
MRKTAEIADSLSFTARWVRGRLLVHAEVSVFHAHLQQAERKHIHLITSQNVENGVTIAIKYKFATGEFYGMTSFLIKRDAATKHISRSPEMRKFTYSEPFRFIAAWQPS